MIRADYRFNIAEGNQYDLRLDWNQETGFSVYDDLGYQVIPHPFRRELRNPHHVAFDLAAFLAYRVARNLRNGHSGLFSRTRISVKGKWGHLDGRQDALEDLVGIWSSDSSGVHRLDRRRANLMSQESPGQPVLLVEVQHDWPNPLFLTVVSVRPDWAVHPLGPETTGVKLLPTKVLRIPIAISETGWLDEDGDFVVGLESELFKFFLGEVELEMTGIGSPGLVPMSQIAVATRSVPRTWTPDVDWTVHTVELVLSE